MKIVLDSQTMQMIALFEQLTGAHVRDCVNADQVIFIVHEGEVGRAVGKGGQHVRNLEHKLKKKVKIIEFHGDVMQFVKNVVAPLVLEEVKFEDGVLLLTAKDLKTRGLLIGRGASNLRLFEAIVKRYYPIKELRVE
ncbi:NusA-like transcription termination signal-binding factor [Candidatus Woesearchaeota archaeon]|nr:NusA-like transcription termination signal-binding factor [Candidatus Woesearchaeota archaeon]